MYKTKKICYVIIVILLCFNICVKIETPFMFYCEATNQKEIYTVDGYRLVDIKFFEEEIEMIEENHIEQQLNEKSVNSIPDSFDNSANFPAPHLTGQQNQGSCTAWAVCYAAVSCEEKNKWQWSNFDNQHCFSPAFIFNSLSNNGQGIHISDAMQFVKDNGCCSLNIMNYNPSSLTSPNLLQQTVASFFKANSWNTISGVTSVKTALLNGKGVVFAFKVPTTFSSSNPIIYGNETIGNGAHAVCIVGYNDSLYGGAFKFINSWGANWGQNGYGWITYSAYNSNSVNNYNGGVGFILNHSSDYSLRNNMGDVDYSDTVTVIDARKILQYCSNQLTFTNDQFVRADVNGDGVINTVDARYILRYVSQLETEFPYFV